MQDLQFILNGGETVRYHTIPTLLPQRVGQHSWGVAMLVSLMALDGAVDASTGAGQGLTVPLLMAALAHDLAEHVMGDLPAPAKRSMPPVHVGNPGEGNAFITVPFRDAWGMMENEKLAEHGLNWEQDLSPIQKRWLKLADAMDGALYCVRERAMGNKLIAVCFNNFRSYIRQLVQENEEPKVIEIVNHIDDMWEQANA